MNALLRNRWLIGAAGVVAAALVVWFVGDVLVLGEWRPLETGVARVVLILFLAGAWAGREFLRAARAKKDNAALLAVIAGGTDGEGDSAARAAHEVALLRQRFEEATGKLKKARFKGPDGEPRYVHQLPWYVIIGAPGSGKTTALVNSGLHFPLPGAGGVPSLTGVGGTRNCDWWFTEEAVLLDTAGRYTTQQSDAQADSAAWLGFLDLLKQFRPRRPLNGTLVTLSMSDLLLWNPEERARYAQHVRARVLELYARLGVRFPVYLLVTKADLLGGFMDFFGELDGPERARVWGATFEYIGDKADPRARFEREFADLERRLYAEMLERLQGEPDLQRRAAIYRFPQEFHGAGPLVAEFLGQAFGGVEEAAAELRGVYFTSGTQEGSPIDRVLGTLARSFNLERSAAPLPAGTGKSFFLSRLLREVIFGESGLAGSDAAVDARARRGRLLVYAAIGAATVLLAGWWSASFLANRDYVHRAAIAASAIDAEFRILPAAGGEGQLVLALNRLRDLPAESPMGAGLSQQAKIGAQAERAYRNALRDALIPRASAALETGLREGLRQAKGNEGVAELLEAYLSLHEGQSADPKPAEAQLRRLWRLQDAEAAALGAHLRAGLQAGPEMRPAREEAIIREARQRLAAKI